MSHRRRSSVLLAVGTILAVVCAAHLNLLTAHAQTKPGSPATAPAIDPYLKAIPPKKRHPIFPNTKDPEVARLYATAYIVGEALRAGVIETDQAGQRNQVDALRNFVGDVYQELGGAR